MEAQAKTMTEGHATLDSICLALAQIVDSKSPFTFNHSNGVANAAVAIARTLRLPRERVLFIRHAALLHDLGKLGVSNAILEKPGKLDDSEWESMRLHPFYTWKILQTIPGFEEMSEVAASHHEKLNGKGYFRGLDADRLSLESRILVVADIFDALSAKRPYRDSLPQETVFGILQKDAPHAIDGDCVAALRESGVSSNQTFIDLQSLDGQLTSY
jgi:HD-GYP domain-containing protein (c-di-GMP phosphodiesterase class II)